MALIICKAENRKKRVKLYKEKIARSGRKEVLKIRIKLQIIEPCHT